MDYKLVITPQADAELTEILNFIAESNAGRAYSFIDEMVSEVRNTLSTFPFVGKVYKKDTRFFPYQKYGFFYNVNEEKKEIEILHVLHGSRNLDVLLEK